ncbi:nucleoside-diphosphate sugar epimerase [Shewanella waksmanii]|uniref:nucleoside-diphosphate sugar epimerase n=1 Tax=Shewanella waksmanii TaxID=213783 RepID=UPI00373658FF
MNAAIVGATGLVGQILLETMISSGLYENIWVVGRRRPAIEHSLITFSQSELTDICALTPPFAIHHSYCCLGTTIKQAGSQTQFIAVDKTAVLDFVAVCKAQTNLVITALGANRHSKVFYNRIKGEVEQALILHCQKQQSKLVLFQPSLLLGKRPQQRTLEDFGQALMPYLQWLMVGKLQQYQPIAAETVAKAMLQHSQILLSKPVNIVNNQQMLALK